MYRQSARRWREVNHAMYLAVVCHCFLPGLSDIVIIVFDHFILTPPRYGRVCVCVCVSAGVSVVSKRITGTTGLILCS